MPEITNICLSSFRNIKIIRNDEHTPFCIKSLKNKWYFNFLLPLLFFEYNRNFDKNQRYGITTNNYRQTWIVKWIVQIFHVNYHKIIELTKIPQWLCFMENLITFTLMKKLREQKTTHPKTNSRVNMFWWVLYICTGCIN